MIKNDIDRPLYSLEEEDDDKPLYSLDEQDSEDKIYDDVPDDDSVTDEDDDAEDEDDTEEVTSGAEDAKAAASPSPLGVLFRTMLTPVEGWKKLKRSRFKTDEVAGRCFYPLVALAAVSEVSKIFYEANVTFSDWAIDGMTTFITFFFGYFTVLLVGGIILPSQSRDFLKKEIGKQFVMVSMSTLAIFWTLIQVLPAFEPVLVFLPLWTIYLIYKGIRVLRIPNEVENSTTGLMCMLVIGAPVLWNWLFSELLLPMAL